MRPAAYRRKGIASLPVSIFFVALVATAFVGVSALASSQSGLASKQISVENALAARQQELTGLAASPSGNGLLLLTQSSGVATTVVYALAQESSGQTVSGPVNYVVAPGQTTTINVTSVLESMFSGTLPSLSSMTIVTSRGLYITSQLQTVSITKQVTKDTTQTVTMYQVSETSAPYYSCNGVVSSSSLCYDSYSASATTHYECASWETLTYQNGNWVCLNPETLAITPTETINPGYYTCSSGWTLSGSECYQQQTYYTYVPGYYTYQRVPYYVPGYWSSYYVPGHWQTYQYWVNGYWTYYTYSYTTYQQVQTGGHWAWGWCWANWGPDPGDMLHYPCLQWVPTYSWVPVVNWETVPVYHSGYWATGEYWVSGYWQSYYVPGYWSTETIRVWHPGYWQTNTRTVWEAATWNPQTYTLSCPSGWTLTWDYGGTGAYWCTQGGHYAIATPLVYFTYSCPNGGTLSGTTCETSYPAIYFGPETISLGSMSYCPSGSHYSCSAYTTTKIVPVTTTVDYETVSTQGSTWLVGG